MADEPLSEHRSRRPSGRSALAACTVAAFVCGGSAHAGIVRELIGRSVDHRAIYADDLGGPGGRAVLVVGCIHGNEPAGIAVAQALLRMSPPKGVDLWVVPVLNPDGRASDTRGNAHGVDLNRNFPYRWSDLDDNAAFDPGPHPLSEPESRAAAKLIERIKPRLSIWFHQHLAVVDDSQGSRPLERRFAQLVGLPLKALSDYPGSVASWENHTLPGSTAFVVELRAGWLSPAQARRDARAILAVAAVSAGASLRPPESRARPARTSAGRRRPPSTGTLGSKSGPARAWHAAA